MPIPDFVFKYFLFVLVLVMGRNFTTLANHTLVEKGHKAKIPTNDSLILSRPGAVFVFESYNTYPSTREGIKDSMYYKVQREASFGDFSLCFFGPENIDDCYTTYEIDRKRFELWLVQKRIDGGVRSYIPDNSPMEKIELFKWPFSYYFPSTYLRSILKQGALEVELKEEIEGWKEKEEIEGTVTFQLQEADTCSVLVNDKLVNFQCWKITQRSEATFPLAGERKAKRYEAFATYWVLSMEKDPLILRQEGYRSRFWDLPEDPHPYEGFRYKQDLRLISVNLP